MICRAVPHVLKEVDTYLVPDRIPAGEPPQLGVQAAGPVVIQPRLLISLPANVSIQSGQGRASLLAWQGQLGDDPCPTPVTLPCKDARRLFSLVPFFRRENRDCDDQ